MAMYLPAGYDSDDDDYDYGGFAFSSDYDEKGERISRAKQPNNYYNTKRKDEEVREEILQCILNGDLDKLKSLFHENQYLVNVEDILSSDWTALMYACYYGQLEIVEYLLNDLRADANKKTNAGTALILACAARTSDEATTLKIVKLLLKEKALVNHRNRDGETAMMMAILNGFDSIVKLLLPEVSVEQCDVNQNTALFYAVEYKRYEAVKLLLERGAFTNVQNRRGFTPQQIAADKGYVDIEALFPSQENVRTVPTEYLSYATYKDFIPTAYPGHDIPAYISDVFMLLNGMRVKDLDIVFSDAKVSLPQLLCATDDSLKEIGVDFPFQRNRIMLGLLRFYKHPFQSTSLHRPKREEYTKLNEYFDIFSGCLKHIIILKCSLQFIRSELFVDTDEVNTKTEEYINDISKLLLEVCEFTKRIQKHIKTVEKKTPKPPPLYIDQAAINHLKEQNYFKKLSLGVLGFIGLGSIIYAVTRKR